MRHPPGGPSPVILFARSRGLWRIVGVSAAGVVLAALGPDQPVGVPLRNAVIGVAPLVAAGPGVFLSACLEHPEPELEPTRAVLLVRARLTWLVLVLLMMSATGLVALHGSPDAGWLTARNLALAGGLSLVAGSVLPPLAAWLPSALLLAVTLLYGSRTMAGYSREFAFLIHPVGSVTANCVALAVFLAGAAWYVLRDARPSG